MRLALRSGLWCFVAVSSVLAAACSDDDDAGAGENAGMSSSDKSGAAGGGAGGRVAGGSGGTSPAAGLAGGGGAGMPGGAAAGDANLPLAGAGGSGDAAGAEGGGEHAGGGGAGGAGGADGEGGQVEPGFAYVSTILGGLVALSRDERGALDALDGSPVGNGHLANVLIDHRRKFLYTLDADSAKLAVYPLAANGELSDAASATTAVAAQPFTAALDPADHFLYVTSQQDGVLSTFAVADDGQLTPQGEPFDLGAPPAVVAVSPSGAYLYVSQQFPGGIRAFTLDAQNGSLLELEESPFGVGEVFGGALAFTPDGAFLYSSGFALNGFKVGDDGALQPLTDEPFSEDVGSDPYASNLAIDPLGKHLYVTQFLLTRHVSGFAIDPDSGLLSPVGAPVTARSPYSVAIDPSGRFVYASNDDDTISGYRRNGSDGTLTELSGSPYPFGGLQPEMVLWQP